VYRVILLTYGIFVEILKNEPEGSVPGQEEISTQLLVFRHQSKGADGLYHAVSIKAF
jgi:hypothetical protein